MEPLKPTDFQNVTFNHNKFKPHSHDSAPVDWNQALSHKTPVATEKQLGWMARNPGKGLLISLSVLIFLILGVYGMAQIEVSPTPDDETEQN